MKDRAFIEMEFRMLTKHLSEVHGILYGLIAILQDKGLITEEELERGWAKNKWAPAETHADLLEEEGQIELATEMRNETAARKMLAQADFAA